MIASAVIQHVGSMLGDKAWERIELLWNFENDAKEMKDKMFNLQVALNNAEKRSQESEDALARLWLKKYKSVAYDMEDTLDELGANAMIWRNSTCTVSTMTLGLLMLLILAIRIMESSYSLFS